MERARVLRKFVGGKGFSTNNEKRKQTRTSKREYLFAKRDTNKFAQISHLKGPAHSNLYFLAPDQTTDILIFCSPKIHLLVRFDQERGGCSSKTLEELPWLPFLINNLFCSLNLGWVSLRRG